MKQLSIRYLDAEKHYVDDWAAYIEKKEMTEEEALEYLRDVNSRTDRYAHIVDMDTFEARTADKRDDVVFEQIAQTDSGLLSLKNSKGEDCYWYYSALDGFEGLDIVGVIPQSALYRQHNNWPIVWLICGTVLLLAVVDGIYILSINRRLRATDKGYIDVSVNADYPSDNYDGAILKFFEGDVPFWVCDTEKVSGMKKRESKSETFSADPFEYEFLYAPMADDGVCEFVEPWFGFAVSQNSDDYEYALEFLRFLAQEDQLNTLASVKGVPSAIKNSSDARYEGIQNAENVAAHYVNDGTILNHVKNYFKQIASGLGNGDYATTEDAARDYVQRCAEVAAQMAEDS